VVLADELANSTKRARGASLLLLYSKAATGAALLARVSDSGHSVFLCPLHAVTSGRQLELDADLILIAAEDEGTALAGACRAIRERAAQPIVVLSDTSDGHLIAQTLDAGADEFLSLDVGGRELGARIDAMLRRCAAQTPETWQVSGLTLCPQDLSVEVSGRRVFLTPIEFRLLACLASAPGKAFTHETLMSRVWGAEYVEARHYLYLYIRYLREKLEPDPRTPRLIVSEWGIGYRLQPPIEAR
jgi:DNA-binding response OmpR family regulator